MQIMNRIIFVLVLVCVQSNTFAMLFDKYEKVGSLNKDNILSSLKLASLGLDMCSEAFQAFKDGQLCKFDAAAGDNMCQVRAHQVLSLNKVSSLASQIDGLQPQVAVARQGAQSVESKIIQSIERRNQAEIQSLMSALKQKKLSEFLYEEKVQIPIMCAELKSLALNFFITKHYSDIGNSGKELIKQLAESRDLTYKQAKDLIGNAKVALNEMTCNYLQSLVIKMGNPENERLFSFPQSSFATLLEQKVKQRQVTSPATFTGMLVLLKNLLDEGDSIVLSCKVVCDHGIHAVNLLFEAVEGAFAFKGEISSSDMPGVSVFVVEGVADPARKCDNLHVDDLDKFIGHQGLHKDQCLLGQEAVNILKQKNILEILLANVAQHYQFLDRSTQIDFAQVPQLREEYDNLKQLALHEGMCRENAKIFRITHIFPATIKEL